uniref:Uncharacterized protein n=1 Tax=Magallana gigas TaxID=29159 RepID=K1R1C8_MAGGI
MTTLILTMVLFICNMTGKIECQGDIKAFNLKEKSEKSSKPCDIRQDNIRNSRLKTTVQLPAQSAMKGNYTPWIAYRDNPQGGPLAGLCLICSKSSSNTITIGDTECDTNATGVCVDLSSDYVDFSDNVF